MRPLPAGDARLKIAARVARALIDRGKLHPWERKEVVERQRLALVDVAVDRQPEGLRIDVPGMTAQCQRTKNRSFGVNTD
jgi:hypothetical protein